MGKKKRRNRDFKRRKQKPTRYTTVHSAKKRGIPRWTKALIPGLIIVIAVAVAMTQLQNPTPSATNGYPTYATGVFYENYAFSETGKELLLSYSFVKDRKIVYVDLPLQNTTSTLEYEGRIIPLNQYKSGNYLPLIILYTPARNVKAGIRTCEPCGGFSMHIDEAKYLVCDICDTMWDLETFRGVSGGCPDHPPPLLPTTNGTRIEVDLSKLEINI